MGNIIHDPCAIIYLDGIEPIILHFVWFYLMVIFDHDSINQERNSNMYTII